MAGATAFPGFIGDFRPETSRLPPMRGIDSRRVTESAVSEESLAWGRHSRGPSAALTLIQRLGCFTSFV